MEEHAILSASGAHQWAYCSGVLTQCADIPDLESEDARQGNAAHWVFFEVLSSFGGPEVSSKSTRDYIGKAAPNGYIVDEDMANGAHMYIMRVLKKCNEVGGLSKLQIEQRLPGNIIHADCGGTPDTFFVIGTVAYLFDFKYGFRAVSAYGNLQMVCYMCGIIELYPQVESFQVMIVQPRCYTHDGPIKIWNPTRQELSTYGARLKTAAILARSDHAFLATGPHCRDCRAVATCPASTTAGLNAIDVADMPHRDDIPLNALGNYIDNLERAGEIIRHKLKALEAHAIDVIHAGKVIPGKAVDQSQSKLKWLDTRTTKDIKMLGLMTGTELTKEVPVTPTQAKAAGVPDQIIKTYAKRDAGAFILVDNDGKRAEEIFGK